jgi:hypothetical protein
VTTADGASWWYAFTSFEEQMKSPDTVKSTFLADIDKLFAAVLSAPEIAGIIVNPWHCTLQLDKELIRIIQPGVIRRGGFHIRPQSAVCLHQYVLNQ